VRKERFPLLLITAILLSTLFPSSAWSEARQVVPLKVFADDLSPEDQKVINDAVLAELDARPDWERIPTPETELIDLMFEADCLEPDLDCLSNIGKNLNQPYLLFVSAEPKKGGYVIDLQLIDVTMSALVLNVTRRVKSKKAINKSIARAATKLFGKKPPPKVPMGTLAVNSSPEGAVVYINKKRAGETPLELKKEPGTYTVIIKKDGYEQRLEEIRVRDGQNTQLTRNLKPVSETSLAVTTTTPVEGEDDSETPYYETWWFWSAVGVGVAGLSVGIAAASGAFETEVSPSGDVGFFFTGQADQDYLLQLQRK